MMVVRNELLEVTSHLTFVRLRPESGLPAVWHPRPSSFLVAVQLS